MDFNEEEFAAKILIIGDSGIGKSSILTRYTENKFSVLLPNTVGNK
jgi:GTPase SAR1 family protein